MKKKMLILAITVAYFLNCHAQERKTNSMGLSAGWQNFSFLDIHASPLAYSTNSIFPGLGLFYQKQRLRSQLHVEVSGSFGTLFPSRFGQRTYASPLQGNDSFQYHPGSRFIHANFEIAYFRRLNSLSDTKFGYWVGGFVTDAAYYSDAIANADWLLNLADLSPAIQMHYLPLKKHSLGVTVYFSVLGAITRPVYALFPKSGEDKNLAAYIKQGTRLSSVNHFQRFGFQADYEYLLNTRFALGATYKFRWLHYDLPKDIRAVDKQFDINFSILF